MAEQKNFINVKIAVIVCKKKKCCKCKGNRKIRLNEELTKFHKEVLCNLNSIHGALLRMNRSIQSEGANGIIKWNRSYTRARRRGSKALNLEIAMICCGFNLHKFHLKKPAIKKRHKFKIFFHILTRQKRSFCAAVFAVPFFQD